MKPQQAVVYVPHATDLATHAMACMEHCARRGYGVFTGDWRAAINMLFEKTAGVFVVARAEHVQQLEPASRSSRRPP